MSEREYETDEFRRTISMVRETARTNGLMLAWQQTERPYSIGFCHLSEVDDTWVAIYAVSERGLRDPLRFSRAVYQDGGIDEFLKSSAEMIGIEYAALMDSFAERSYLWRFRGFLDGEPSRYPDNGLYWRALWGRIVESVDRAVEDLPLDAASNARSQLLMHAAEGQIVLDR